MPSNWDEECKMAANGIMSIFTSNIYLTIFAFSLLGLQLAILFRVCQRNGKRDFTYQSLSSEAS